VSGPVADKRYVWSRNPNIGTGFDSVVFNGGGGELTSVKAADLTFELFRDQHGKWFTAFALDFTANSEQLLAFWRVVARTAWDSCLTDVVVNREADRCERRVAV